MLRSPARGGGVLAHVFSQYEIAFAVARELPLGHTRSGPGLLALARCALLDPVSTPAQELLDYLRTPGVCAGPSRPIAWRPRCGARVCARSPRPGRG